jgi:hypothetical protein
MRSLHVPFVWTAAYICNDLLCEQDVASESILANMYTLIFTHFQNRVLVDNDMHANKTYTKCA